MRRVLLLGFLLALAAFVVAAQDANSLDFKMTTPFIVENTRLPAGAYKIRILRDAGILELTADKGEPSVLIDPEPLDTPAGQTNLFFAKYGNKMFLTQIDFPGGVGSKIPMSWEEKSTRKTAGKPMKTAVKPSK